MGDLEEVPKERGQISRVQDSVGRPVKKAESSLEALSRMLCLKKISNVDVHYLVRVLHSEVSIHLQSYEGVIPQGLFHQSLLER